MFALLIVSTWPSLNVQNGHRWSPPIFLNISRLSKCKYLVSIPSFARWLQHDESRQDRMQQKRSTTWIFSTGVSGHAHIRGRGPCFGTGILSATVTGHFGHAPEDAAGNMNILSCTTVDRSPHTTEDAVFIPEALHFTAAVRWAQVSLSSCSALHCIIPDPAERRKSV